MGSRFIGVRFNYMHDDDLIDSLENSKDMTKEIKRLMRLGLKVSDGEYLQQKSPMRPASQPSTPTPAPLPIASSKPLDWSESFIDKPSVDPSPKKPNNLKANILAGFD